MRNVKKLIKCSKNSELIVVSNKNLSEILPSSGWGPGPGNLSQNGEKPTLLMMSPMKNPK